MLLKMISSDRQKAAITLYLVLITACAVVFSLLLMVYAENSKNKQNLAAAAAPIAITVSIGQPPSTVVSVPTAVVAREITAGEVPVTLADGSRVVDGAAVTKADGTRVVQKPAKVIVVDK